MMEKRTIAIVLVDNIVSSIAIVSSSTICAIVVILARVGARGSALRFIASCMNATVSACFTLDNFQQSSAPSHVSNHTGSLSRFSTHCAPQKGILTGAVHIPVMVLIGRDDNVCTSHTGFELYSVRFFGAKLCMSPGRQLPVQD